MPYEIEIPGHGIVEVPDSVPIEKAQLELAKQFPPSPEQVYNKIKEDPFFEPSKDQFSQFEEYSKSKQTDWIKNIAEGAGHLLSTAGKAAIEGSQGAAANPLNYLEGIAQGTRGMYELVAQSQNPDSLLFRFKNLVTGDGSADDRYNQFLEARKFNQESLKFDSGESTYLPKELVNPEFAKGIALFTDASMFIPGIGELLGVSKLASKAVGSAAKAVGKTIEKVATPIETAAKSGERIISDIAGMNPEAMRTAAYGAAGAGLAIGTPIGAAMASVAGIPLAATLSKEIGQSIAKAGENLMTQRSRIGALESIGNVPGAGLRQRAIGAVGKLGGDAIINNSLKATTGALEGAAIGAGLGYLNDTSEGAASGIGAGAGLGAAGAMVGHGINTLTGNASKAARKGDFDRYVGSRSLEEANLLKGFEQKHGIDAAANLMDFGEITRGALGDLPVQFYAGKDFEAKFGSGRGVTVVESNRPFVAINMDTLSKSKSDTPLYTLGHEAFHAFERVEQLHAESSKIKDYLIGRWDESGNNLEPGLLSESEVLNRFDEYSSKLPKDEFNKLQGLSQKEKAEFVSSELAADYLGRLVSGQKPDAILKGFTGIKRELIDAALIQNASKSLSRIADKFESAFGVKPMDSLTFKGLRDASPALNSMLRELVRSRRRLDEAIVMSEGDIKRSIKPQDLANPSIAKQAVELGLADRLQDGSVRWVPEDIRKGRELLDAQELTSILQNTIGAKVVDGVLEGSLSPEQIQAVEGSKTLQSRIKEKVISANSAIEKGHSIFIDYNAATERKQNKITGKWRSRYSSGIPVSQREVLPYKFYISKAQNPLIKAIDISKIRGSLERLTNERGHVAGKWNSIDSFLTDLAAYFSNLDKGEAAQRSVDLFGPEKAVFIGDFVNDHEKGGRKFVRDFRLDRVGSIDPRNFRAKLSEVGIQKSKARWMPSEKIGDSEVTKSENGLRIVSGKKHRLYDAKGKLSGVYDTKAEAIKKGDKLSQK